MRGFRNVILEGAGLPDVLPTILALGAYAVVFTALCIRRVPSLDSKTIIW